MPERILDVIPRLTPSSFVDWGLIGGESTLFPLFPAEGRRRGLGRSAEDVGVQRAHALNLQLQTTARTRAKTAVTFFRWLAYKVSKIK